jgi:hypothetical protein
MAFSIFFFLSFSLFFPIGKRRVTHTHTLSSMGCWLLSPSWQIVGHRQVGSAEQVSGAGRWCGRRIKP